MSWIDRCNLSTALRAIPPDLATAKTLLLDGRLTREELAAVAVEVTEDCFLECYSPWRSKKSKCKAGMHSYYILDTLRLLLDHGLDSNVITDDENVMWNVQYIDAPNVGAAALRLLLEHGGDPNLEPYHSLACFEDTDIALYYGYTDSREVCVIQSLCVLAAYGGRCRNGHLPLIMLNGYNVDIFKKFEDYEYIWEKNPYCSNHGRRMIRIYEKDTGEEVARYC